jgi:hypothetical protein
MKTYKRISLIIIVIIFTVACIVLSSTTYAIWQKIVSASQEFEAPVEDFNPSLKYLVFKGLDSNGDFSDENIVNYAVVGYEGLVAEIIIPETYNDLAVTMIGTDPNQIDSKFSNNELIISIFIPTSVVTIAGGTFQALTSLEKVEFSGTSEDVSVEIGDFAFGYCTNLTTFTCDRPISGDMYSYFWGTQLI